MLAQITDALDRLYDPRWAESWDAVGLVCGDPAAEVSRVLFAVDPVEAVVDEALDWGASLLVTHHPLLLRSVHGVPATTSKGRVVHRLIQAGCGLFVAHTNADAADPGVSDALAEALGLVDIAPLDPVAQDSQDKLVTFVPDKHAPALIDALAAAGAGSIGPYDRCAWTVHGTGTFRPGPTATPTIGAPGRVERVEEVRVEMVLPRSRRTAVVAALRSAHPYEEPAFDVIELASLPSTRGIGRVGSLPEPETLEEFTARVASALPETVWGVRAAGDPEAPVRRVAVCGGAGDSLLPAAAHSGVDVYVTADLRHHPATEAIADGGPALVDVAHWASEWPWLPVAAGRLVAALKEEGTTVETRISSTCTDAWTVHSKIVTDSRGETS